jgi:putative transposase
MLEEHTKMGRTKKLDPNREPDFVDQVLQKVLKAKSEGTSFGISAMLEEFLNEIMLRDREVAKSLIEQIPKNGFYKRKLNLSIGELNLKIPRVRFGSSYRPAILPEKWKRVDKEYEELLLAMMCNGYTYTQIEKTCHELNLPFSKDTLEDVVNFMAEKMDFYKRRELDKEWIAVFIDACHTKVRDENRKNQKHVTYIACGITLEGKKEILGSWTLKGNENKSFWTEVLQDLIQRGATKILSIITDNFNGLDEVIKKLYPLAYRQLCMVHLARNLYRNLSKSNVKEAIRLWKDIKEARNYDEGIFYFDKLIKFISIDKQEYAEQLAKQKEDYLTFLHFPEDTRTHFYTTNAVESINSGIERMRNDLGGYFASQKTLDVNLFIQFCNLQDLWFRKPMPKIRSCIYELNQLFQLRYGNLT